jgi:mycothiol synthase
VRPLEVKRQLSSGDIEAVSALVRAAERADGHQPLDEHRFLDAAVGGGRDFAGLLAWPSGYDHPVAYANVIRGERRWELELVVDPQHRDELDDIGPTMLSAALDVVRREGGGHVHLWVYKPTPAHDRMAEAVGLARGRDLWQLRRPLPVGEPNDLETRPFEVGRDEQAWLDVNNRAFDWHPEQGGWTLEDLEERIAEPWFDPAGFLLHEEGGRLLGFCWTKEHRDVDPPLGEIYVIAADPAAGRKGLGKPLTLAGLDHLHRRGVGTGMLYVDGGNALGMAMYDHLGFTIHHTDVAWTIDVPPS